MIRCVIGYRRSKEVKNHFYTCLLSLKERKTICTESIGTRMNGFCVKPSKFDSEHRKIALKLVPFYPLGRWRATILFILLPWEESIELQGVSVVLLSIFTTFKEKEIF